MRSATRRVGGLAMSWSSTPQASSGATGAPRSAARDAIISSINSVWVHTSPSGWKFGGWVQPIMASASGKKRFSRPLSASRCIPSWGRGLSNSLSSSSRIRSADTESRPEAPVHSAAQVAGSMENPSWAEKRMARSMRSWSSPKRAAGSPMARSTPASRSAPPPTKSSTRSGSGS